MQALLNPQRKLIVPLSVTDPYVSDFNFIEFYSQALF